MCGCVLLPLSVRGCVLLCAAVPGYELLSAASSRRQVAAPAFAWLPASRCVVLYVAPGLSGWVLRETQRRPHATSARGPKPQYLSTPGVFCSKLGALGPGLGPKVRV